LIALTVAALGLPTAASAAAPAPSANPDDRVLVFTKATGEQHASTSAGVAAIRQLGKDLHFAVEATDDAERFKDKILERFRAVVFLNTTGELLDDAQQAAFERYFKQGGGFVGIHAAIEAEPDWQFLTDVIGTRAAGASNVTQATVKVADRVHPAGKSRPQYWQRTDQWYNFAANVRGVSHVLATVDESTYTGGTMGLDHPVTWCKDYRGGRSFYTAGATPPGASPRQASGPTSRGPIQ
jgi:cytochrome c